MEELMKKIEGIIFDMDGTLFDTERVSFKIWQQVMRKHGYSMSKEVYISLMGRKRNDANKILLKLYGEDFPLEKIRAEKEVDMLKFIEEKGVPVKEGAFELLDFLVENRYKVALATSTCRERALSLLKMVGITDRFSVIICGDDVVNSKPDPEIFLKAAEGMKAAPQNCVVIEDSPAGIKAACNGEMISINVTDLKEPDEEMRRLSNKIYSNLLEVKDYLLRN